MPKYRLQNGRLQRTLSVTQLEDRTTPVVIDVTGVGSTGATTDGNVIVRQVDEPPTGSGVINSFLRIQRQDFEHGYNSDARGGGWICWTPTRRPPSPGPSGSATSAR